MTVAVAVTSSVWVVAQLTVTVSVVVAVTVAVGAETVYLHQN